MYHFCTYFDKNYLIRGLALYKSLTKQIPEFYLYVLCLDNEVYKFLKNNNYDRIIPVSLEDFENGDDELKSKKNTRSKVEYYFTCTPSFIIYILKHFSGIDIITYLDSDLYFFGDPKPIYEECGNNSILIIGHRFHETEKSRLKFGVYNVGYLSFRNDMNSAECLEWWRERCLEWCYSRVEDNKFADQKYLDNWPILFKKVCQLKHKGAGLAPWNTVNYNYTICNNQVYVDDFPLIFYHFHNFNRINKFVYDAGDLKTKITSDYWFLVRYLYSRYIIELNKLEKNLKHNNIGHTRNFFNNDTNSYFFKAIRVKKLIINFYGKIFPADLSTKYL
tara:strand:- start:687 stop:1685 length:999 start_codon:yes stop_codon:yes gene_type:complete